MSFLTMIGPVIALVAVILVLVGMRGRQRLPLADPRLGAPRVLLATALVLVAVGVAGPTHGTIPALGSSLPPTIWIAVDVSRSMLVTDVPTHRLTFARRQVVDFVASLADEEVGIIAFAGDVREVCPPTASRRALVRAIEGLNVDSAPPGGSNLLRPLAYLDHALADDEAAVILLISDGGHDRAIDPLEVRKMWRRDLPVWTVGVGDPNHESPVPASVDGPPLMKEGAPVLSRLNEGPLEAIATAAGGTYLPGRTRRVDLAAFYRERMAPRAARWFEQKQQKPRNLFQACVASGWALALYALSRRRWR